MPPKVWDNTYLAYVAFDRQGKADYVPFAKSGRSFADAKQAVIREATEIAESDPGVPMKCFLRKGSIAAAPNKQNVKALFSGPEPTDVLVCTVRVDDQGRSHVEVSAKTTKASKRALPTKHFVGHYIVGSKFEWFRVPATKYMDARDWVLKLAAEFYVDNPRSGAAFYVRNQEVPEGKKLNDVVYTPSGKNEELIVKLRPRKDQKAEPEFFGMLNLAFKPNQKEADRRVFTEHYLDVVARAIKG